LIAIFLEFRNTHTGHRLSRKKYERIAKETMEKFKQFQVLTLPASLFYADSYLPMVS